MTEVPEHLRKRAEEARAKAAAAKAAADAPAEAPAAVSYTHLTLPTNREV